MIFLGTIRLWWWIQEFRLEKVLLNLRGDGDMKWKTSSPIKLLFYSPRETFGDEPSQPAEAQMILIGIEILVRSKDSISISYNMDALNLFNRPWKQTLILLLIWLSPSRDRRELSFRLKVIPFYIEGYLKKCKEIL